MQSIGREADIAAVELSNHDLLHVWWPPGAVVTEPGAKALKNRVADLSSGHIFPMLVEMASMKSIERRADEIFSAPWPLTRMPSSALLP